MVDEVQATSVPAENSMVEKYAKPSARSRELGVRVERTANLMRQQKLWRLQGIEPFSRSRKGIPLS